MFAAGRRLPGRVAAAFAQRRRYVAVVLRGSAGTKEASFKLQRPWEKPAAPKYLGDATNSFLRVLKPASAGLKDESRATMMIIENNAILGTVEMVPAIDPWDDRATMLSPDDTSDDEGLETCDDDGEEVWSDEEEEIWGEEGEEVTPSDDDLVERIPGLESKSSDEAMMVQLLGPLEETSDDESRIPDVKRTQRRTPSSFVIDLCLWPWDGFAHATILRTDDKGDCTWQSSWSFNLGEDPFMIEEIQDPQDFKSAIVALSEYPDGRLTYTGVISGPMLEKFKVSLKTNYSIDKVLGRGGEGDVYECTDLKHSEKCAVKLTSCIHMVSEEPSEPRIMKELFHQNIKRLFCAWSEEREDTIEEASIFLAQEFSECTLEDYLNESSVKTTTERVKIFCEALAGISYLHKKGYVHRDIKSNNIFLDHHGHAKIGDFGQSDSICSASCSNGCEIFGTLLYSSPEMLHRKPHDEKTDVYSLGLVYFELFGPRGTFLDRCERLQQLKKLMRSRKWKTNPVLAWERSELSAGWTGDISVMMNMLKESPGDRPSSAELLEVLTPDVN